MNHSNFLFLRCAMLAAVAASLASTAAAQPISTFAAPDAWSRGSANTAYYGWDVFELTGQPLNDSTPDVGTSPGNVSMVQNNALGAGANGSDITGSNNLYSGFAPSSVFDLGAGVRTLGVPGTGFTTVLVQVAGSAGGPGGGGDTPSGFSTSSFRLNNALPTYISSGYAANSTELFWMEWNLTGNTDLYSLHLTSEVSSSSLSKITIDTAWNPVQSLDNTNATVAPEPSATLLLTLLGGAGTFMLHRARRRAA